MDATRKTQHLIDAAARIEVFGRIYGSDSVAAGLIGISLAELRRLRRGEPADAAVALRLTVLATVVEVLSTVLSPSSIPKWLEGPNAHLAGRTPMYLLKTGHVAEVFTAIDALQKGDFA